MNPRIYLLGDILGIDLNNCEKAILSYENNECFLTANTSDKKLKKYDIELDQFILVITMFTGKGIVVSKKDFISLIDNESKKEIIMLRIILPEAYLQMTLIDSDINYDFNKEISDAVRLNLWATE